MKKLALLAVLFFGLSANAQQTDQKDNIPYIEVTGTAEKEVVPDIIYITIVLQDKVVNKAEYTIDAQEVKLKSALRSLNIDLKNLSLADASSDIIKYKRKEKGINQRQEYILKVSTAKEVQDVFEALYNNEIKEAAVTRVDHTQMDALRKEVRISAIKAAKDKATYLLQAIGEVPGQPLIIREEGAASPYVQYRANSNVRTGVGYYEEPAENVNFKNISITFSYYVKYSIK